MAQKILLIEGEKIVSQVLENNIIKAGYEFHFAGSGKEGLVKMKNLKPSLILLDIRLPKLDGFEVMERMKRDKDLKEIPIIVISNSGQAEEIEEAKKLGAKDWVVKTQFDPQEIINKIINQIGK